mgnify:CR=1 FL=1
MKIVKINLSIGHIQTQIDRNRPLYFVLEEDNNNSSTHAVVCRGYYDTGEQINLSIWNPFYLEYEALNGSNFKYVTKAGTWYTWIETIQGF